jgi:hypothetical protein
MSQSIVISPSPIVNLDIARGEFVKGLKKTGEVLKTYAEGMCQAFNLVDNQGNVTTPWFELKGKLKTGVNEERARFVAEMQVAGFEKGTIDVYWQRVKEASGRTKTSTKVQGAGNDTDSKTLADLKTIINRIFKAEEAGEDCQASEIKGALMEAYEALGGDTDKLG